MAISSTTYYSKLYRNFKAIETGAYRAVIRFFEANENNIKSLEEHEYFDLAVSYADALFEVGAYKKHIEIAYFILEFSIQNNIKHFNNEDIYEKTLFRIAASYYNLFEIDKAEHILKELLKINPYDEFVPIFLKKCLIKKRPVYLHTAKALSIFLFLLASLIVGIEVLVVCPFFPQIQYQVEILRIVLFVIGFMLFLGSDFFYRWNVERSVNDFVEEAKHNKSKKSKNTIPS